MWKIWFICLVCSASSLCGSEVTFSVMGCGPYHDKAKEKLGEYVKYENELKSSEFLFHLGDLFPGSLAKTMIGMNDLGESSYIDIKHHLKQQNKIPTFVLPGDNETVDRKDPEQGWMFWEKHFHQFYKNFDHNLEIKHSLEDPFSFSFNHEGILFIGLNKVGGKVSPTPFWKKVTDNTINWIKKCVENDNSCKAIVVLSHGNMECLDFKPRFLQIIDKSKKPTLYINADKHYWFHKTSEERPYLHHVQLDVVHSEKNHKKPHFFPPVQVTIDLDSKQVFKYNRRINETTWQEISK